jgi:hypothetical protein
MQCDETKESNYGTSGDAAKRQFFFLFANLQRGNSFQVHGPIARKIGRNRTTASQRRCIVRKTSISRLLGAGKGVSWPRETRGPAPTPPPRNPSPRGSWTREDKKMEETPLRARGEQEPQEGLGSSPVA